MPRAYQLYSDAQNSLDTDVLDRMSSTLKYSWQATEQRKLFAQSYLVYSL